MIPVLILSHHSPHLTHSQIIFIRFFILINYREVELTVELGWSFLQGLLTGLQIEIFAWFLRWKERKKRSECLQQEIKQS